MLLKNLLIGFTAAATNHPKSSWNTAALLRMSSSSSTAAENLSSKQQPRRRLLFLHGMFLPPECYTKKLAVEWFQALEDNNWEVVCVTSPRRCPDPAPAVVGQMFPGLDVFPEWLNSQAKPDGSKKYQGLDESLSFLQGYLKEQPRFDVIAGHSNGALMASVASLKMESDASFLPPDKHWKAILLFNAPNSYETEVQLRDAVQKHGPIQVPSIHVFGGPADHCWEGQQQLQRIHHPTGKVFHHEAGHFFPSERQYYDDILQELNNLL